MKKLYFINKLYCIKKLYFINVANIALLGDRTKIKILSHSLKDFFK